MWSITYYKHHQVIYHPNQDMFAREMGPTKNYAGKIAIEIIQDKLDQVVILIITSLLLYLFNIMSFLWDKINKQPSKQLNWNIEKWSHLFQTQTPKQRLSKRQPGCHPDAVFHFINVFMIFFFLSSADATWFVLWLMSLMSTALPNAMRCDWHQERWWARRMAAGCISFL